MKYTEWYYLTIRLFSRGQNLMLIPDAVAENNPLAGQTNSNRVQLFFLQFNTYSHSTVLHLSWDFSVLVEYKRLITSVNTKPSCCHNHRKTVHAILVINQEPYQPHHPCAGCYLILNHLSKLLPSLHTGSVSNRLEDVMKMSSGGLLLRL